MNYEIGKKLSMILVMLHYFKYLTCLYGDGMFKKMITLRKNFVDPSKTLLDIRYITCTPCLYIYIASLAD